MAVLWHAVQPTAMLTGLSARALITELNVSRLLLMLPACREWQFVGQLPNLSIAVSA